ncbi:MAG: UTRA domain-containing protein [Paracoccaceae bacterium]
MDEVWTIPEKPKGSISENAGKSRDRKAPYYTRIRDHIAGMIEAGTLRAGDRLPPERAMAEEFSITRVTARHALLRIEAEGLIFREDRRGWFVSPPRVRYDPIANISFTESIAEQGRVSGTTVMSRQQVAATPWQAAQLECTVGDPVFLIKRTRSVDARPVLVENIHIRSQPCPGLLKFPLDQSLTGLMEREFGIIENRSQIDIRPTALLEGPAGALGVAVGTPGLYISRTIRDQFDVVIELDEEFWRHDAISVSISGSRQDDTTHRANTA